MLDGFRNALREHDLDFVGDIIVDGSLHRIHVKGDDPGTLNGWYVLFDGPIMAGSFGCWKRSIKKNWCFKPLVSLTRDEHIAYTQQLSHATHKTKEARKAIQAEVALECQRLWQRARPVDPHHPY